MHITNVILTLLLNSWITLDKMATRSFLDYVKWLLWRAQGIFLSLLILRERNLWTYMLYDTPPPKKVWKSDTPLSSRCGGGTRKQWNHGEVLSTKRKLTFRIAYRPNIWDNMARPVIPTKYKHIYKHNLSNLRRTCFQIFFFSFTNVKTLSNHWKLWLCKKEFLKARRERI